MSPREEGGTRPTPYQIPRFGGLDLREEPDEGGPQTAIDLLNVDFDRQGAVRTRDGFAKYNPVAHSAVLKQGRVWYESGGSSPYVIAADTNSDLVAFNNVGASVATLTTSHIAISLASIGTAGAGPYVYIGGSVGSQIKRFDGGTFTSPAGLASVNARVVAVQPIENRLVAGYTSAGNTSRVWFSNAGAPETFSANDFVDLFPNDGETIQAMVAWGTQVFVFKRTRFFTFYGNSTDADGNAVFNYRPVDADIGASWDAAVAAEDGVYFTGRGGIYRTTGGAPEKISAPLEALFSGGGSRFFSASDFLNAVETSPMKPVIWGPRIIFPIHGELSGSAVHLMLVYYPQSKEWSVWSSGLDAQVWPLDALPPTSTDPGACLFIAHYPGSTGTAYVYKTSRSATTDDGTAIVSRYRSSFYSPIGSPSQECSIRESILTGSGTPSYSVSRDYGAVPTSAGGAKTAVALGVTPAILDRSHRVSQRGRRFSYQIEAASGAWEVESIMQHITGIRSPGLRTQ